MKFISLVSHEGRLYALTEDRKFLRIAINSVTHEIDVVELAKLDPS